LSCLDTFAKQGARRQGSLSTFFRETAGYKRKQTVIIKFTRTLVVVQRQRRNHRVGVDDRPPAHDE
jgi:hypothetical protein